MKELREGKPIIPNPHHAHCALGINLTMKLEGEKEYEVGYFRACSTNANHLLDTGSSWDCAQPGRKHWEQQKVLREGAEGGRAHHPRHVHCVLGENLDNEARGREAVQGGGLQGLLAICQQLSGRWARPLCSSSLS